MAWLGRGRPNRPIIVHPFREVPPRYYDIAPGKIAANINYDGGNYRGRTRDLTQLGAGKSSLDAIAKALVEKQGRVLVPDQFPDRLPPGREQ